MMANGNGHRAKWSVGKPTSSVDVNGTAGAAVPLLDNGVKVGTLTFTITPDRALRVEFQAEPGATPLTAFEAWSR